MAGRPVDTERVNDSYYNMHTANCATACILIHFWYLGWLHLWPLLTDALLLVYHHDTISISFNPTERNVMDLSRKTELAKPSVHTFLFNFCSKFHSCTAEMQGCSIMLWPHSSLCFKRHISKCIIHFPENSCNMELLNTPRHYVVQSGYYKILFTKFGLKIGFENYVLLRQVDFRVPKSVNSF
jgi:hypothetical protein